MNLFKDLFYFAFAQSFCSTKVWVGILSIAAIFCPVLCADTRSSSINEENGQLKYKFKTIDLPLVEKIGAVQAFEQDAQGFLWIGGTDGLARFDGYSFKIFDHEHDDPYSLAGSVVNDILLDSLGRLWVANDGGLSLYDAGNESFERFLHSRKYDFGTVQEKYYESYQPIDVPSKINAKQVSAFRDKTPYNQGAQECGKTALDMAVLDNVKKLCSIGWTDPEEWVEYKVNAKTAGNYLISLNAATSVPDKFLHLEIDKFDVSGQISIKPLGWNKFRDYIVPVYLKEGIHTLRVFFDTGSVNLAHLEIKRGKGDIKPPSSPHVIKASPSKAFAISHYNVSKLLEDSNGNIWVGSVKGLSKFSRDGLNASYYFSNPEDSGTISNNHITSLMEDHRGNIWVGTKYGLNSLRPNGSQFRRFFHDPDNDQSIDGNSILSIFEDEKMEIWVGTSNGLNKFDLESETFYRFSYDIDDKQGVGGRDIYEVLEDESGYIWAVSDGGGVSIKEKNSEGFIQVKAQSDLKNGLLNNQIKALYKDRYGGIWLGHYPAGISKLDSYASAFNNYIHDIYNENSLNHSDILSVDEDSQGNLWVGTEGGLNYIDRRKERITRYSHDPEDLGSLPSNPVMSVLEDSRGKLWIGTWQGGFAYFDKSSSSFIRYNDKENTTYPSNEIESGVSLFEDKSGSVWLGGQAGLAKYSAITDQFKFYDYRHSVIVRNYVFSFMHDSRGSLWIGGWDQIGRMHIDSEVFEGIDNYTKISKGRVGDVRSIAEGVTNDVWFATWENGLYSFNLETNEVKNYKVDDGLPDNRVSCLLHENRKYLWVATAGGLARLDLHTDEFKLYTKEHGLPGNAYRRAACIKTSRNELVFGSTKGLTIFDPNNIVENTKAPPVALTGFMIANKPVNISEPGSPLSKSISQSDSLTLTHLQSVFTFEFAAMNFVDSQKNQYAYKLEPFDKDWNYIGSRRMATYTNMNPGEYVFRVKASNNEGIWNEEGASINVTILPPWWRTWWAYTCYLIFTFFIIALIIYVFWSKQQREREKKVTDKLKELDGLKDEFLANTSHELRTPLHGIIGLADLILANPEEKISDKGRENLRLVSSSCKRLSALINDILDFTKLKQASINLSLESVDLNTALNDVIALTKPLLKDKKVEIQNDLSNSLPKVIADRNRLQQIFHNLIGNAIKFTSEGSISINARLGDGVVHVSVKDTGIGIPEEKQQTVFTHFEQVDGSIERKFGGTGLGLAVTKKLVNLHGGEIGVESKVGEGATFTFTLPRSDMEYEESQNEKDSSLIDDSLVESVSAEIEELTSGNSTIILQSEFEEKSRARIKNGQHHILIVDDEMINRRILIEHLHKQNYLVTSCSCGNDAIELLESDISFSCVDLILLDIMMPDISGYEVAKNIRGKYHANQLPIIFLTAKSGEHDIEKGYMAGGNDYLKKPFSKIELQSRIEMHLSLLEVNRGMVKTIDSQTKEISLVQRQLVQSEKMSSLGILVSGVGHEINNPIGFIGSASQCLQDEIDGLHAYLLEVAGEDSDEDVIRDFEKRFEEMDKFFHSVKEGVSRVNGIVDNLSKFSRMNRDIPRDETLVKGIENTLSLVKAEYKNRIGFTTDYTVDPLVNCIISELNQVFMNLMVNACQAMLDKKQKNGNSEYQPLLNIKTNKIGNKIAIEIQDNGPGIPDDIKDHIFEQFYTTKPEGVGTGLGLSISNEIIKRHNGVMEVESSLGDGSLFRIVLPIA